MTLPSDPPPPEEKPQALPLALDLPMERPDPRPAAVGVPARGATERRSGHGIAWRIALTLVAIVAIAAGATVWLLPRWVKDQVIEAAAAHGVTLTVEDAGFDGSGFRLTGLRASAADLPGASAQAPELVVETQSLKLSKLTLRAAVLTLDGPWSRVDTLIDRWRAGTNGGVCSDCLPSELVVDGSRVVWTHPMPDSGNVEANDVHLGSTFRGNGAEVHVQLEQGHPRRSGRQAGSLARRRGPHTRQLARARRARIPRCPSRAPSSSSATTRGRATSTS